MVFSDLAILCAEDYHVKQFVEEFDAIETFGTKKRPFGLKIKKTVANSTAVEELDCGEEENSTSDENGGEVVKKRSPEQTNTANIEVETKHKRFCIQFFANDMTELESWKTQILNCIEAKNQSKASN